MSPLVFPFIPACVTAAIVIIDRTLIPFLLLVCYKLIINLLYYINVETPAKQEQEQETTHIFYF